MNILLGSGMGLNYMVGDLARLGYMTLRTVFQYDRTQFFGIELPDIVRGPDDFAMLAIAYTGERGVKDNREVMKPRIRPDPLRQCKTIHGRHFDVAQH